MKHASKLLLSLLAILLFMGCKKGTNMVTTDSANDSTARNSIYHWKTTFNLDSADVSFLKRHDVKRIYVRMFDVATEPNFLSEGTDVVPIATTKFESPVPKDVEIVPVTYITLDALREMQNREAEFANIIIERLLAMANYNHCGKIREVQFDCDWTGSTKGIFNKLCETAKDSLNAQGIALSATIRLHQMQETPPPLDRGVLMVYNTGALKHPESKNSILHMDDVKPYLKPTTYALPLDYAYPTFGWGVLFESDIFVGIVSETSQPVNDLERIRRERPTSAEVLEVKAEVEKAFGAPARGNILYHLDASQLAHYSDSSITQIYR